MMMQLLLLAWLQARPSVPLSAPAFVAPLQVTFGCTGGEKLTTLEHMAAHLAHPKLHLDHTTH